MDERCSIFLTAAHLPGNRYSAVTIIAEVRLFFDAIGPDFIFVDNNALPHKTSVVKELLENKDVCRMGD
ncbi:hypothetical protein TNCV_1481381 [Trichonephila clavipes]|nr:hypothetical protein TNCV_1481381 [Trichonephila clavipes]